jgi:hypothetical protein
MIGKSLFFDPIAKPFALFGHCRDKACLVSTGVTCLVFFEISVLRPHPQPFSQGEKGEKSLIHYPLVIPRERSDRGTKPLPLSIVIPREPRRRRGDRRNLKDRTCGLIDPGSVDSVLRPHPQPFSRGEKGERSPTTRVSSKAA